MNDQFNFKNCRSFGNGRHGFNVSEETKLDECIAHDNKEDGFFVNREINFAKLDDLIDTCFDVDSAKVVKQQIKTIRFENSRQKKMDAYNKFVGMAADHIQIFQAFFAPLAGMISGS